MYLHSTGLMGPLMASAECIALSKVLEIELAKQEPDTQPVDELAGDIRC